MKRRVFVNSLRNSAVFLSDTAEGTIGIQIQSPNNPSRFRAAMKLTKI
ncbi:MAG: hypothetical protein ACR2N3_09130 [Pyrinomonadaceae bacterium]